MSHPEKTLKTPESFAHYPETYLLKFRNMHIFDTINTVNNSQIPAVDYLELASEKARNRLPLMRRRPKLLCGVCQGLASHLGGKVALWRLGFVCFIPFLFTPVLYIYLAIALPKHNPSAVVNPNDQRVYKPLTQAQYKRFNATFLVVAALLGLSALAVLFGPTLLNQSVIVKLFLPCVLMLSGVAIIWVGGGSEESEENEESASLNSISQPRKDAGHSGKLALGILGFLIAAGGGILLVSILSTGNVLQTAFWAALVTTLVLLLMLYPLYLRLKSSLRHTAEAKVREATRADIAAHLHDSVLQTLALIRARADDANLVRTLARAQEKDLRTYLYADRKPAGTSLAAELKKQVRNLEQRYQQEIDLVITGDVLPSLAGEQLLAAASEAIINAAKHGQSRGITGELLPISVYAELSELQCALWVRDRGSGFSLADIPADRAGIRDSIQGRMEKIGGLAQIRSPLPGGGTEVHLVYEVKRQ